MKANTVESQSLQLKVLTENQCEQIIETAFRVLERTGCNVHHAEALQLLKDAGCSVDGVRVKIPTYVIQKALTTAPKQIMIYDREGEVACRLSARSGNFHTVMGMENQYRIDMETGEKRLTVKKDAYEAGLVAQKLSNINVACGLSCISDCTPQMADVYETRMLLEATTKPQIVWNFTRESLKTQVDLCAAVAGGLDKFLEKPFIIAGGAASVPLSHAEDTMDKMLYMFELGLPSPYVAATMMGGTSPRTVAGSLVQGLCETLVGLVLSQLKKEGCPFIATEFLDLLDMRTMSFTMSSPEYTIGALGGCDIFKYLNIPFAVHLGATDSPIFDQQAAFDIGVQLFAGLLGGANLNFFSGYLETAMSSSLATLMFCNEALGYLKSITAGIVVNEDTLAEEVIHQVGPNGNFLAEEHTLNHFKESWMPDTMIRTSYDKWQDAGGKDLNERYKVKVKEILEQGPEKPLNAEVIKEMDAIVAKAEKVYQ